ncbi:hypothetical protein EJ110_NYTH39644 [Nymphaea thermarum]|nr:hypothetical protein EJ110_NYTH39644 [Nymphaea thermarum]
MAMRLAEAAVGELGSRATRAIFPSSRLLNYRSRSSGSSRKKEGGDSGGLAELVEVEIPEGSDLAGGVRLLQDAVHAIMVSRAAPVWLPFRPGSSYWVPPRKKATAAAVSTNLADLVGKLTNPMTDEESLSLTTSRGWPSRSYFVEGASPDSSEIMSKLPAKSDGEEE